ncbi:hypothetical protein QR680_014769 [Steinernema hermaphroditum]|uniref:Fatty-acid and retinol-binding protein 1 n=1 Tax=Steinernema hermaphroditum TaxID=289476 RepID=A0AA39IA11_9BILA|nr:hypothetical protein QR680_014769 [Steinernema hermaphroditum]
MWWFVIFSLFLLTNGRPSVLVPDYDELTEEEKTMLSFFPKFLFELVMSLEGDEVHAFVQVYYQALENNKTMDFESELQEIRKISESAYQKALPYAQRLKAQLSKFSPKLLKAYESIVPTSLDFGHDFVQEHVIKVAEKFHGLDEKDLKVLVETYPSFEKVVKSAYFITLMKDGLHMPDAERKKLADKFIDEIGRM